MSSNKENQDPNISRDEQLKLNENEFLNEANIIFDAVHKDMLSKVQYCELLIGNIETAWENTPTLNQDIKDIITKFKLLKSAYQATAEVTKFKLLKSA